MRLSAQQRDVLAELYRGPVVYLWQGPRTLTLRSLQRRGLIQHVWNPPHFSWALTFRGWIAADNLNRKAGP